MADDVQLGVKSFFCVPSLPYASIPNAPTSPSSELFGKFQKLKSLSCSQLCEYVEVVIGRQERIIVVSEHHPKSLKNLLKNNNNNNYNNNTNNSENGNNTNNKIDEGFVGKIAYQILQGLCYLNENGIVHRNLSSEKVLLDSQNNVKLADYGLYYMTSCGKNVPFAIGDLCYLAPEVIARGYSTISNKKSDIWSLGIILLELLTGELPWQKSNALHEILTVCGHKDIPQNFLTSQLSTSPPTSPRSIISPSLQRRKKLDFSTKAQENLYQTLLSNIQTSETSPLSLLDVLKNCLIVCSSERPTPAVLITHPYFRKFETQKISAMQYVVKPYLECLFLPDTLKVKKIEPFETENTNTLNCKEIFHFWKVSGGDLEDFIALQNKTRRSSSATTVHHFTPSINKLPLFLPLSTFSNYYSNRNNNSPHLRRNIVSSNSSNSDGGFAEESPDISFLYDSTIYLLSVEQIKERLQMDITTTPSSKEKDKEKEVEYQFYKYKLFCTLLENYKQGLAGSRQDLVREGKSGIPSLLRGEAWAALLGVTLNSKLLEEEYSHFDRNLEGPSDKQIDLDVPRCHQYHPLLSSPEGHSHLRNVLKTWVFSNQNNLVYWQGVDSVAGCFISANFNNEPRAFACVNAFVQKYLYNFYKKDNSLVLEEYLMLYRYVLAYHDPLLAVHLINLDFHPSLYAVAWFLTSFTHIFPLPRIYPLFDSILLASPSFPIFIAVSIMTQLRSVLLTYDFNQCILLFSNLPSIDIQACISDAQRMFEITPPSICPIQRADIKMHLEWYEERPPLEVQKNEIFPRITVTDLFSFNFETRILDIRPTEEFSQKKFPGSINITNINKDPRAALPPSLLKTIEQNRKVHNVIIASGAADGGHFATQLLHAGIPFVSLLTGGIDAIIASGRL